MRIALLALLALSRVEGLCVQADKWEKEIAALEAKPNVGDILFIGSSTIRLWDVEKHLPGLKINNRGFGGSQIADSVRYADRILIPLKPKTVLLFAGGNDLNAGKSPEQVFEDYKAFVKKVRDALPETRVLYMSVFPNLKRAEQLEKTKALNALVAAYAKGDAKLGYVDVAAALCPDGQPRAEVLRDDKLHLNEDGYAIISKVVRDALTK
ncbi:MAG TPA: GDSL-type esterase/lipase family protein [Planctomycetota bacterium]